MAADTDPQIRPAQVMNGKYVHVADSIEPGDSGASELKVKEKGQMQLVRWP